MDIKVIKHDCIHESGTKFYSMFIAQNASNNTSILIQRWGRHAGGLTPASTGGQTKVTCYNSVLGAKTNAGDIRRIKRKRGYESWEIIPPVTYRSVNPLMAAINKIAPDDQLEIVRHLIHTDALEDEVESCPVETPEPEPVPEKPAAHDARWGAW